MIYSLTFSGNLATYRDKNENHEFSLPAKNVIGLAETQNPLPISDPLVFKSAVTAPDTGCSLREIVHKKNAKSACIIISDITRGVPTHLVAPHIVNELEKAGIASEDIIFIVALGVHRPATGDEMQDFIGQKLSGRYRVINHNAFDENELVSIGKSTLGNEIKVNKTAYSCDLHIVVGKVELHEFAGYSGGRKSILPGICSETTIVCNHSPEMLYSKGAGPGLLDNNPMHLEMVEAANLFGVDFCVNFVVNNNGLPAAVFSGEMASSYAMAVEYVRKFCSVVLSERPDIIVTTPGYPFNCELYQAFKGLFPLMDIVDKDMTIILYAACPEGVNSPDLMCPFQCFDSLEEIDKYVRSNYKIQMDHALPLTKMLHKKPRILVCAPGVPDEDIRTLRLIPCSNLGNAISSAIADSPKENPRVLFFPQSQKALITCHY